MNWNHFYWEKAHANRRSNEAAHQYREQNLDGPVLRAARATWELPSRSQSIGTSIRGERSDNEVERL